jgi:hypothetical protein
LIVVGSASKDVIKILEVIAKVVKPLSHIARRSQMKALPLNLLIGFVTCDKNIAQIFVNANMSGVITFWIAPSHFPKNHCISGEIHECGITFVVQLFNSPQCSPNNGHTHYYSLSYL